MIDGTKSAALADEEKRQVEERAKQLQEVTEKIDTILMDANITWQEWHDIVGAFNLRNEIVVPRITLKELKERYEQHT